MINAGAILSAAIIRSRFRSSVDAFKAIKNFIEKCVGGVAPVAFDNTIYLSELNNAERNLALAYFMREKSQFLREKVPDMTSVLETYFQACSITVDVRAHSIMAATLAAGGTCPITRERVMEPDHARNTLQLMYNCGMYDSSGRFCFEVCVRACVCVCMCVCVSVSVSACVCLMLPVKFALALPLASPQPPPPTHTHARSASPPSLA